MFRKVNARTQTPVMALVVFGALVAATAIIPCIIYFLITVAYARKRSLMEHVPGSFSLGRWARPVIGLVLVWTVLVMLALSLPSVFHGADWVVLGGAVLAALWYFLALRGWLRAGTAGPAPIERLAAAAGPAAAPAVSGDATAQEG